MTLARQADGALRPSDLEKSRVRNPHLLLNYSERQCAPLIVIVAGRTEIVGRWSLAKGHGQRREPARCAILRGSTLVPGAAKKQRRDFPGIMG